LDKPKPEYERRKHKRLKIHLEVAYRIDRPPFARISIGENEIEALALDLSEGGIAILTEHDIPVTSLLSIELFLGNPPHKTGTKTYEAIKTKGKVRSNIVTEKGRHRLGISFEELEEEDRTKVANFVRIGLGTPEEPHFY
jgi:c-di-GMP-binding flagellar brake protein YcgR